MTDWDTPETNIWRVVSEVSEMPGLRRESLYRKRSSGPLKLSLFFPSPLLRVFGGGEGFYRSGVCLLCRRPSNFCKIINFSMSPNDLYPLNFNLCWEQCRQTSISTCTNKIFVLAGRSSWRQVVPRVYGGVNNFSIRPVSWRDCRSEKISVSRDFFFFSDGGWGVGVGFVFHLRNLFHLL